MRSKSQERVVYNGLSRGRSKSAAVHIKRVLKQLPSKGHNLRGEGEFEEIWDSQVIVTQLGGSEAVVDLLWSTVALVWFLV